MERPVALFEFNVLLMRCGMVDILYICRPHIAFKILVKISFERMEIN
jgi:hypothetical protein